MRKLEHINKIQTQGWMRASIVQKGYLHPTDPRQKLYPKSMTSKEDWQKFTLSPQEKGGKKRES